MSETAPRLDVHLCERFYRGPHAPRVPLAVRGRRFSSGVNGRRIRDPRSMGASFSSEGVGPDFADTFSMPLPWNRRLFLKSFAIAGVGASLDSTIGNLAAASVWQADSSPYGPLTPVAPLDGGTAVLALPPDFVYRILSSERKMMSDGLRTPPAADGMAAFEVGGFIRLLRNHEVKTVGLAIGHGDESYDPLAGGGVTTLVVDPVTRRLVRDFLSLSGTVANCSGGLTPWNSWISCEETLDGPQSGYTQRHGYCFEVSAEADRPVAAVPLRAMGRFYHEAVAIDAVTGIAYLTEDEGSAGFYRFIPDVPGKFALGGRLQMLAIVGAPQYETRRGQRAGQSLPVRWVDIREPDPDSGLEQRRVYEQGKEAGGARFRRLEGAAWGSGSVYFSASTGGDAELGQVWRYTPYRSSRLSDGSRRRGAARRGAEGELTLLFESRDAALLKAPDNVCLAPRGSLLICEDSTSGPQYVRCFTPSGELFDLVRNCTPGLEHGELAGVTFSPDGQTLFLNLYAEGKTAAIWGPWARGPL